MTNKEITTASFEYVAADIESYNMILNEETKDYIDKIVSYLKDAKNIGITILSGKLAGLYEFYATLDDGKLLISITIYKECIKYHLDIGLGSNYRNSIYYRPAVYILDNTISPIHRFGIEIKKDKKPEDYIDYLYTYTLVVREIYNIIKIKSDEYSERNKKELFCMIDILVKEEERRNAL